MSGPIPGVAIAGAIGSTSGGTVTSVSGTAPIASSGGNAPVISLNNTAVTPGAVGDLTHIPTITFDAKGRATASSQTLVSARGTFVNGDLVAGVLTVTHSFALSAPFPVMVAIFNNTNKQIIPDQVTGATNSVAVDLTSFGALAGTWGYVVLR